MNLTSGLTGPVLSGATLYRSDVYAVKVPVPGQLLLERQSVVLLVPELVRVWAPFVPLAKAQCGARVEASSDRERWWPRQRSPGLRVVVAADGTGNFKTAQSAIDHTLDSGPRRPGRRLVEALGQPQEIGKIQIAAVNQACSAINGFLLELQRIEYEKKPRPGACSLRPDTRPARDSALRFSVHAGNMS